MPAAVATEQPRIPSSWLTPRPGRAAPIHRWFVFPHSFAPALVHHLLDDLPLPSEGTVLDPFCGAGTTLVECQRRGVRSVGLDLLPLAVLVSRAKVRRPSAGALSYAIDSIASAAESSQPRRPASALLSRAFTPAAYGRIVAALDACPTGPAGNAGRVAILRTATRMSCLRADGGWLRLVERGLDPRRFPDELATLGASMLDDLPTGGATSARVLGADARWIPLSDSSVDAVITSPPYPNRHDYTRVFAVELELLLGPARDLKALRRQALHSHPEAKPRRRDTGYAEPPDLTTIVAQIADGHPDPRIPQMLRGYFRDLHDVLLEVRRVVRPGGTAAFVVGNARYCGVDLPVDSLLASMGAACGFGSYETTPVRLRGNSAQQMGRFGRRPARESIVVLHR